MGRSNYELSEDQVRKVFEELDRQSLCPHNACKVLPNLRSLQNLGPGNTYNNPVVVLHCPDCDLLRIYDWTSLKARIGIDSP